MTRVLTLPTRSVVILFVLFITTNGDTVTAIKVKHYLRTKLQPQSVTIGRVTMGHSALYCAALCGMLTECSAYWFSPVTSTCDVRRATSGSSRLTPPISNSATLTTLRYSVKDDKTPTTPVRKRKTTERKQLIYTDDKTPTTPFRKRKTTERKQLIYTDRYTSLVVANKKTYIKLHREKDNWSFAKDTCQHEGGYLIKVDTKEKFNAIVRIGQKHCRICSLWIGLEYFKRSNTFKWVDGSPLTFSNWGPGQPNHGGPKQTKGCVSIAYWKYNIWRNSGCQDHANFICERDK